MTTTTIYTGREIGTERAAIGRTEQEVINHLAVQADRIEWNNSDITETEEKYNYLYWDGIDEGETMAIAVGTRISPEDMKEILNHDSQVLWYRPFDEDHAGEWDIKILRWFSDKVIMKEEILARNEYKEEYELVLEVIDELEDRVYKVNY